jgi:glycogen debranching enzyme
LHGQHAKALNLFDRLLSRRNDVGLLAEEFDPRTGRMLGNFPQAYSHVGLINAALSMSRETGPAEERAEARQPQTGASRAGKKPVGSAPSRSR